MRDLAITGLLLISHGLAFLLGLCVAVIQIRSDRERDNEERFR